MPSWPNTYWTRPEQSKPRGVAPAHTYGTPRYCNAIDTTPLLPPAAAPKVKEPGMNVGLVAWSCSLPSRVLAVSRLRWSRLARAAAAVEGGKPEHFAHVRVGVVVTVDRLRDVELPPAAHEVARGAEDRVRRIVGVGDTVPVRVDAPARPGRGHELHPADCAGRAWPEVAAEVGLDLVDGAEHRPRDGVGVAGRLPTGA